MKSSQIKVGRSYRHLKFPEAQYLGVIVKNQLAMQIVNHKDLDCNPYVSTPEEMVHTEADAKKFWKQFRIVK